MSHPYSWQKLYEAVSSLATSSEPLSRRLEYALISLLPLKLDHNFPDHELGERLDALMSRCARIDPNGAEGRIAATVGQMNTDELSTAAQEIVDLYNSAATNCEGYSN